MTSTEVHVSHTHTLCTPCSPHGMLSSIHNVPPQCEDSRAAFADDMGWEGEPLSGNNKLIRVKTPVARERAHKPLPTADDSLPDPSTLNSVSSLSSYSVEIRRPLQPPVLTTRQITSCRGRVGKPLKKEVTQFNCFLIEEKTIIENASCLYNNDHHYSTDLVAVASVSPFDLRDCGGLQHGACHKQSTRAIDSPPPPLPPLALLPACHRYCKSIPSILLTRRVLTRTHTHALPNRH